MEGFGVRFSLGVEMRQHVQGAVGFVVILDKGQAEVPEGAGIVAHRPDHPDVISEIEVVKADEQAIGCHKIPGE